MFMLNSCVFERLRANRYTWSTIFNKIIKYCVIKTLQNVQKYAFERKKVFNKCIVLATHVLIIVLAS